MVRAVIRVAIGLDLRDAKPDIAVPKLLAQQIAGDIEGITRVELSRE